MTKRAPRRQREITGRFVLFCVVGFFAVVFAVNAALVRFATSTFGGIEVASSYQAGLKFRDDIAQARRQDALHWSVDGKLDRQPSGNVELEISVDAPDRAQIAGVELDAGLAHPADNRRDRRIVMRQVSVGHFRGTLPVNAGQWELKLDLSNNGRHMFRSESRINLR